MLLCGKGSSQACGQSVTASHPWVGSAPKGKRSQQRSGTRLRRLGERRALGSWSTGERRTSQAQRQGAATIATSTQESSELRIASGKGGQTQLRRVNREQRYWGKMGRRGEAGPETPKQRMPKSFCQLFSPSVRATLGAPCPPARRAGDHSLPSPAPAPAGRESIQHGGQVHTWESITHQTGPKYVAGWHLVVFGVSVFPC